MTNKIPSFIKICIKHVLFVFFVFFNIRVGLGVGLHVGFGVGLGVGLHVGFGVGLGVGHPVGRGVTVTGFTVGIAVGRYRRPIHRK